MKSPRRAEMRMTERLFGRGRSSGPDARGSTPARGAKPKPNAGSPLNDQSVQRVQAGAGGEPTTPPSAVPLEPSTEADLSVPASERGLGGGEPTQAEAAVEAAAAPAAPPAASSTLLMRALSMQNSPVKITAGFRTATPPTPTARGTA